MKKENLIKALELINSAMDLLVGEFNEAHSDDSRSDETIVLSDIIGSVADAQGQLKDLTK